MNDFIVEILMNYAGEEEISHLFLLCNATKDFLNPEDVNIYGFLDEGDIEREFIWAIQQKFEVEYQLLDYLVGAEKAENEYDEDIDYLYLEFDFYTRSFRFDEEMLPEIFGEDLLEDYEDSLNEFIDGINRSTTLKILNLSGNNAA
jgi:hypothetical protein